MSDHELALTFMGTPDFAVPSLDILVKAGYPIKCVVTAPDKPAGRGLKVQASPVKQYAENRDIPVLQPTHLKDPLFIEQLKEFDADVFVVVAFRILPEVVYSIPSKGAFNLHASLLPDYRGAAPINWAIINGERETGVTTFFIEKSVDTGEIIFQDKVAIGPNETAGELHDKLMHIGARLVLDSVDAIEEKRVIRTPQREVDEMHQAPKIFTGDCEITFEKSMQDTHNFIRGLSPHPGAWMMWDDSRLKIFRTEMVKTDHSISTHQLFTDYKTYMRLVFEDGWLNILDMQLEGKNRMTTEEFLRGLRD